ncbi:hypothetical protein BX600DRAFT_383542 [Xylariales sp. PMI_506]|nr:hypothetical protein BX600DRAFT_383542 [Xylariales sp. PMI_506]
MAITPIGTIGGDGEWLIAFSWSTTGIAALCFVLRLYTRVVVVKSYGWDDTIYNLSFVLLLACTTMVHISTLYGLGQNQAAIWDDSHDRLTKALLYLIIAQIFGVSTMGVAKISLGLFLLRLVMIPWHRVAIWGAIAMLMVVTGVTSFVFTFQCVPPAYLWDKTIKGGHCPILITPFAILLGVACVVADLFFAIFPWLFVWKLKKPFKERIVIAGSMSLGLVSAACGVKRTIGLGGLAGENYTTDAVPTCGWSIAELSITLVCIAIPVCIPSWRHVFPSRAQPSSPTPHKAGSGGVFALRTFGGGSISGSDPKSHQSRNTDGTESQTALRSVASFEARRAEGGTPMSIRSLRLEGSDDTSYRQDIEKQPSSTINGVAR